MGWKKSGKKLISNTGRALVRAAKSTYKNRRPIAKLAVQGYTIAKSLQGLINSERHIHQFEQVGQTINHNGVVTNACPLFQGDGPGNRTGNSVFLRGLAIRGMITRNTSGIDYQTVRMIIFQDKYNSSNTVPTNLSEVLQNTGGVLAPFQGLDTFTNQGRFTILKSKLFKLTSNQSCIILKEYIRLKTHVKFVGSNGGDVHKGHIYIGFISNVNVNDPSVDMSCRVYYMDN